VTTEPLLRISSASFGYAGAVVVEGLSLTVGRGEVIALVGPNGSGKSTVVKAVLGLAETQAGTVELGLPRAEVGYVPQRESAHGVVPSTVEEFVVSGRLARLPRFRPLRPQDRAAVRAAIDTLGLGAEQRTPLSRLSGGQHRRALIARALASQPSLLFMDEPLAGVDADSQQVLAATLTGLAAEGATLVLVLHELGPLEPLISRVVRLHAGAVVYDGPLTAQVQAVLGEDAHADHVHDSTPLPAPGLGLTG
jgi:zinc transport system ATP-binding protein